MTELNEVVDRQLDEFMDPIKSAFQEIRDRLDKEEAKLLKLFSGLRRSIYSQTSHKASKIEELNLTKSEIQSGLINPDLDALKLELLDNIEREIEFLQSEEEDDTWVDEQQTFLLVTGVQTFQKHLKSSQDDIHQFMTDVLVSDKHDSVAKQTEKVFPNFVRSLSKQKNQAMSREDASKLYPAEIIPEKSFGHKGNKPGEMNGPLGITIDRKQRVYVADCYNSRIQVFSIDGVFLCEFGRGELRRPYCIAVHDQSIFVTDYGNDAIYTFEQPNYKCIGQTKKGELHDPNGITVSKCCDLYVADSKNNRIAVFNVKLQFIREIGKDILKKPSDVKLRFHQLYVVDNGKPCHIHVFSKTGEHVKSMISLEGEPFWNFLCFDRFDNILISDNSGKALYAYTREGELVNKTVFSYGTTGVAVTRNNTILWANVNDCTVKLFHTM